MLFSTINILPMAIAVLILFSLFVQMSEGATYSVVPFINKKALGSVSGIVGAGGNFGAVMAGFLFKGSFSWPEALFLLGVVVMFISFLAFAVRFSTVTEQEAAQEMLMSDDLQPALAMRG
jgi:NNP family nitrate/nitrite transporter-like MFS transporter